MGKDRKIGPMQWGKTEGILKFLQIERWENSKQIQIVQ